jgi:hypothetical protein
VWFISCLHAAGGILVALSVLYSDSVTKTVAVSGALVLTTVLGHSFFGAPLDSNIILGCVVTILSIFTYRDDAALEDLIKQTHASEIGNTTQRKTHKKSDMVLPVPVDTVLRPNL